MWKCSVGRGSRSWQRVCAVSLVMALAVAPLAGCRTSSQSSAVSPRVAESFVIATPGPPGSLGAITGTATHEGAPLPGTTITISSPALQGTRVVVSNVNGDFAFRGLPPGPYTIKVEMEGMATVTRVAMVDAGYVARVPVAIQISSVAEAITVTAAAPSILASTEVRALLPQPASSKPIARRQRPPAAPSTPQPSVEAPLARSFVQPTTVPLPRIVHPAPADACSCENYARVEEGPFRRAAEEPFSTFAIDTDRASFANARRFIDFGSLPPVDSVRVEEMINYFDYGYPDPNDGKPFSITTEIADCPWSRTSKLLRIGLQGKRIPPGTLPPGNLVFLIDTSGSMQTPDKLFLVQASLKRLVRQLRDEDRVAIVAYAGAAGLVLPSTSGRDKWAIDQAIDSLQAGGSTAGGAGIQLAYKVAADNFLRDGNNRVILATDGDFNVGVSATTDLQALIEAKRKEGVFLSVLGVGTGNLNDAGMETLADKGNGHYAYLDSLAEAEKVLVREMSGTLLTIAKDVKIQVEFNPARVGAYRLVGYDNRALERKDFDDDTKDAGELGAGHSVTALYELVPPGGERDAGATGEAREEVPTEDRSTWDGAALARVKLRYKEPKADVSGLVEVSVDDSNNSIHASSDDLRFAAAVAQFGLLLRESQYRGEASWKSVLDLAASASSLDTTGDRAKFVELARKAEALQTQKVARGN